MIQLYYEQSVQKNALINRNGFRPERNSKLPDLINDLLPASEIQIQSVDLAQHVTPLRAARKAFITSGRLKN